MEQEGTFPPPAPSETPERTEAVSDVKNVSFNPKARLRTFAVENEMTHFERSPRNPAPAPNATRQLTRNREVRAFEIKYRGGVPCEVREELIAAFNVLGGLRKTIQVHKQLCSEKGFWDEEDTEIDRDLVAAFVEAKKKAFDLLKQCGFKKALSFGKRVRRLMSDRNVSVEKRNKATAIFNLLVN